MILRPLDYPKPAQLMFVATEFPELGLTRNPLSVIDAGLLSTLGVQPAQGRLFTAEETSRAGGLAPPLAIISYELWQAVFGGQPLVGQTVNVDGRLHEILGIMVGTWSDDHERLMRMLVASGKVPALSQLSGSGGFADERLNDALGHAAFDYIESRWGRASIRRFINALIVPRVDRTYDAVFDLTPAEFDAAFRQYAERRFAPVTK